MKIIIAAIVRFYRKLMTRHIYALTLAFFNDASCVQYLNRYLDYFSRHLDKWKTFREEQHKIEKQKAQELAKFLEQQEGVKIANDYLQELQRGDKKNEVFSTEFFDEQIATLHQLSQYTL